MIARRIRSRAEFGAIFASFTNARACDPVFDPFGRPFGRPLGFPVVALTPSSVFEPP
jgi:hypothetical protein